MHRSAQPCTALQLSEGCQFAVAHREGAEVLSKEGLRSATRRNRVGTPMAIGTDPPPKNVAKRDGRRREDGQANNYKPEHSAGHLTGR